jgi:phosphomannomutase
MQVDASIFKSYDIRGIYNQNLFDSTAEAIGRAFATYLQPQKVIVGRDGRTSGPALHKNLLEGLLDSGVHVVDIGMVSTDEYYYACATLGHPGIMITASHNPKEYNGFKMVRKIPYLLSGAQGIQEMRQIIEQDAYLKVHSLRGEYTTQDVKSGYLQKLKSLVQTDKLKSLTILADTANGMVGPAIAQLFQDIPQIKIVPMYFDPDGTFPNHGGDPLQPENRLEITERIQQGEADLGVMFDPDGDRFFAIDRTGRFVPGDFMTAILSAYFLQKYPKSTIVYDIRSSKAVPDTVQKHGGKPLYNRVGHAYIKKRMMDEDAVFGGEITGHYYFKDYYFCDSGLAPLLYLLDALSQSNLSLDQIVDEYTNHYFISGEINNKVADVSATIASIKSTYAPSANSVIEVDGVTCEYDDWRFNVRGSNTEPLIRLNVEADTPEKMAQKRDELLKLIQERPY